MSWPLQPRLGRRDHLLTNLCALWSWTIKFDGGGDFGDSGGPIFITNGVGGAEILGILHGGNPSANHMEFTGYTKIKENLDIEACISATCHQ